MRGKVLLALALLLAIAAPAAARWGMPDPLTDRGRTVEDIYVKIVIAGILVFTLVFVLLVFILARYRESTGKGRSTHEKHRGSIAAEMTWTLVPLVLMLWIGYIAYAGLVTLDRGNEDLEPEMSIQVTGYQFAWEMDYGGGAKVLINPSIDSASGEVTFGEVFHVPADVPIQFNITSGDVIHAFNILDSNRAYVSIDDANPGGPHKNHQQVHVLPAGTYHVQCKEMCGPGHAYMRAAILAEPRAAFDRWLEGKTLAAGHELVQTVHVTADGDSLDTTEGMLPNGTRVPISIVTGTFVILEVENTGGQPLNVSLSNTPLGTVPAGETRLLSFNTAEGVAGDRTIIGSNGGELVFRAINAKVVDVDLSSYHIDPQNLLLTKGETYLVRVHGLDSAHNYFIGHWDGGEGAKDVLAKSPDVSGGGIVSFVFTPTESGTFDTWCNVAGHYAGGMHAHATVA
ncbi:MAG: cytochrome c oxidase subunit [Thermoplasmata archaeon]|jgi:heme/copper-type cytochrome/quinol oxidase subunit 2|nr:cytochrome c oxidase subunit [Thermoplasmata archaeon]